MLRTVIGSFRLRLVVSTVEVRNAAPKGSLLGFSVDGIDDGIVGESLLCTTCSVKEDKISILPKILVPTTCFLEEEDEFDFDNALNNPIRPSSLE
jgi:hypothetical protein